MYNHSSSVFNNSLLKVPRDPLIGQPLPLYEQEQDCNYHLVDQPRKKMDFNLDKTARNKYLDKETNKSFMEFFNNIPEYHEVNHLNNTEFYKQLEKLKLKKQLFEENLYKEIKIDPDDTEVIEDYRKEKLGGKKSKGKKKTNLKPFCATPVKKSISQTITPDLYSEFSDKDESRKKKSTLKPYRPRSVNKSLRPTLTPDIESEFSDKDLSIKPPSRRSVRIETPSDKFSEEDTPDPNFRSKSRAQVNTLTLKSSGNLTDWEEFTPKSSKPKYLTVGSKKSGNLTDWEDVQSKIKVPYTSGDFKEPLSDWQVVRSKAQFPSNSRSQQENSNQVDIANSVNRHNDIENRSNLRDHVDRTFKSPTNLSEDILNRRDWEHRRTKSKIDLYSGDNNPRDNYTWGGYRLKPNYSADDLKEDTWQNLKSKSKAMSASLDLQDINEWQDEISKPKNCSSKDVTESENLRPKSRANYSKTNGNITDWEDLSIEKLNMDSSCNSPVPLQTRSAPNSPARSKPQSQWSQGGITIPKPFQMTVRDEENKIVDELYVKMKKPKEDKPEMFRAHDVPIESQIPLFDQLLAEQHRRSFISKEKRKAALRAQMKPFSFTKRDEEIQELDKELSKSSPNLYSDPPLKIKKFKAKPIPRNLFSNYIYRKMHEDEYYRALQKKIRAEELLKAASLPPSMAKREKTKPKLNVCPRSYSSLSKEEQPIKKSKSVPNYRMYHDKYEKELEDLKNEFISTSPRPFKLKTAKRGRRNLRQSSASSKSSSCKTLTSSSFNLSSINTSNLAAILRIQSARNKLELEMLKKLEDVQLKEEARWREKLFRKKPVWQMLAYSHEDDLAMRLQLRRDEEKLRSEEHKMMMQLMYGRVHQQPTLFERQSQVKIPRTRKEFEDQVRMIYGKPPKHQSHRSISNLSNNKRHIQHNDCEDPFNSDDSDRSKEKGSSEEKEKCDCLSDDMDNNEKLYLS